MSIFSRTGFSHKHERAAHKAKDRIFAHRRSRFRILACIDGSEASYDTVRYAARFAPHPNCAIVILYVRPIDKGLRSGGLNIKVARQNLLEAGGDLPGLKALKNGLEVLKEEGLDVDNWKRDTEHMDAWGDPVGDNKVVFHAPDGRTVILKLKTAPDVAAGILDQYHFGPYNLIILNEPSRWRSHLRSIFDSGVVQRVTSLAPCSVMVARDISLNNKGFLLYNDRTARSMQAMRRAAVLAHTIDEPITIIGVAEDEDDRKEARESNRRAKETLAAMGINVKRVVTVIGDPVTQIIKAGIKMKVIVVPDEGQSRLHRVFRGSVAYDVIKGAVTSVMDVR